MQDILELSIGVTNLTLCLPVTLAKAWHISRRRSEGILTYVIRSSKKHIIMIQCIYTDYALRERRHSLHLIQDGRWPTIEEHDQEAEEVEEEIPVSTDQETGKKVAIELFQKIKSVDEKHSKKERVDREELNYDENEAQHLSPKRPLSKLISQFEDNISSSSLSPNLSYSSPVKPSVNTIQDRPKTICHAQAHSAPK